MNNLIKLFFFVLSITFVHAQEVEKPKEAGHGNTNKFRQLYDELATPTPYRTASGAPGKDYYQQRADYKMNVEVDDHHQKLYGTSTITYYNNSPDALDFLWVQLDQNKNEKRSDSHCMDSELMSTVNRPEKFVKQHLHDKFEGGFNIQYVKDLQGNPLKYTIHKTMMRIDLPIPLKSGAKISFQTKWWYNIIDHTFDRERSGYEYFKSDRNHLYVIAQFYPRMAVYNETEGWQNTQYWGKAEFALSFGNYEVNIAVPSDHILEATGELLNRVQVYTPEMLKRYQLAEKTFDKPVIIVSQKEAVNAENGFSEKKKTWKFKAENVRDFAFATSRKFIMDAMAVKLGQKNVMAISLYPKEGNPLWEDYSTKVVAHTLKSYSEMTFDYPYHKAVSVHSQDQGMEYPMICWNYGRPEEKGYVSERTKYGMISVIMHEVGHNWFPMIVNSDERQWAWMDEGLNSFMQYLTEQKWELNYPSRRGPVKEVIEYMSGEQRFLEPIMSNPENIINLGANAYTKTATALNILRETVMGKELFDHAFKTYANRWKFKHPTPEDFFRTMEDASAVDLDWFFRGWFYTTDYTDIAIKDVKQYFITDQPNKEVRDYLQKMNKKVTDLMPLVYAVAADSEEYTPEMDKPFVITDVKPVEEFLNVNYIPSEQEKLLKPSYFYEVIFEKLGGLVMPIIIEVTYEDNSKETHRFPAQIWRMNDQEAVRVLGTAKKIKKIILDPNMETADIELKNNVWPKPLVK